MILRKDQYRPRARGITLHVKIGASHARGKGVEHTGHNITLLSACPLQNLAAGSRRFSDTWHCPTNPRPCLPACAAQQGSGRDPLSRSNKSEFATDVNFHWLLIGNDTAQRHDAGNDPINALGTFCFAGLDVSSRVLLDRYV